MENRVAEQMGDGAGKRGPKPRYTDELFEGVRARVAGGTPVTSAVRAEGAVASRFYACVKENP